MSSFVPKNPEQEELIVANLSFFPAIDANEFREVYRVDDVVNNVRVQNALTRAIIDINDELAQYKAEKEAAGIAKLEDVESDTYGEGDNAISVLVHHYKTAIYSRAKAHILEAYRNYDTTNAGDQEAGRLEDPIDDYLSTARVNYNLISLLHKSLPQ